MRFPYLIIEEGQDQSKDLPLLVTLSIVQLHGEGVLHLIEDHTKGVAIGFSLRLSQPMKVRDLPISNLSEYKHS